MYMAINGYTANVNYLRIHQIVDAAESHSCFIFSYTLMSHSLSVTLGHSRLNIYTVAAVKQLPISNSSPEISFRLDING